MNKNKSILVISPGYSGDDGIACLTRQIVGALTEIRPGSLIEVWSWAGSQWDATEALPASALVRSARNKRAPLFTWALREALSPQKGRLAFVLHAHFAPLALPIAARGAYLIQFLIGIEVWKPLTLLERYSLLRARRLIAISAHTVARFKLANPSFESVDSIICHPGLPPVETESVGSECPNTALVVGRMSSEERYKGHDLLLDVWGAVLKEIPEARLLVAGDGDDRARLEAKARNLGLQTSVEFMGRVHSDKLERLYRRSAFTVLPSRNEGFGFVFLEAMRHGKPVIAGIGAGSEIVVDGYTGFVVDPDRASTLVAAIVRLFQDPVLRKSMGERGRTRFEQHFTQARFRDRLNELLPERERR
jgi:phosphatidylinositol alpha-1,6-mannosyltransferase